MASLRIVPRAARALACRTTLLFALGAALWAGSLRAQTATPQPPSITLKQALDFAAAHEPELFAARARTGAARADAQVPRGQWRPHLGVTAELFAATANNTTASTLPGDVAMPRIGGTPGELASAWQPYASNVAGAGVRQELFDFGRISAQSSAADAQLSVEEARQDATSGDVALAVTDSFYRVLAAHEVASAAQRAFANTKLADDEAAQAVKVGLRAQIDRIRADAEVARAQVTVSRSLGALLVAQGDLAAAIGSPEPRIDATGSDAAITPLPQMGESISQALARDPDLIAAARSQAAALERTRAVRSELRPDLSLSAAISGRSGAAALSSGVHAPGDGFLPEVPNWDVGVLFNWPIYDGVVSARASASEAREQVASAELAALRQRVIAQVQQAWTFGENAFDTLPALEKSAEAARANEEQATARFKSGLGTALDLADAEQILIAAEVDLADGRFDYARARARLARLTWENLP